ncbi:hypothetical protein [Pectobacterium parmentieri]|uniref:DUF7878 domain-containing protein n=1 Tax=Pectobacterium parmentieri TaxID=1905730 RepID=A0A8B3FFX0_PECPM|nr:hypothetical protein [Pectobacterium parmentieri]AOR61135.1 hypothetical protein A8F97_19900 [Pectobacterium parmentieri]AYH12197.1 hypothetical protein C5E24_22230 [Pectobacterium parmentieri]AYH20912.1 hypothetical protein C5E22_22110 [Pectobacterium parmentieri]AYH38475.1 hypothetical protein C5E17_21955 [Pectobacterium parmentieri]AZS58702.1 hypothetical protein C5E18_22640 [Pectobacterium parmentieri]
MEYPPGERKTNIDFNYLTIPSVNPNPQLLSEIEGRLIIKVNDEVFFDESDILLLELAKELSAWISVGSGDFIYYSMDYEEGPILSFQETEGSWRLSSVWCDEYIEKISYNSFLKQAECFISNLVSYLNNSHINHLDGLIKKI